MINSRNINNNNQQKTIGKSVNNNYLVFEGIQKRFRNKTKVLKIEQNEDKRLD